MHNPWDKYNPSVVCMDEGTSETRLSNHFVNETRHDEPQIDLTYRTHTQGNAGETALLMYRTNGGTQLTTMIYESGDVKYFSTFSIIFLIFHRHLHEEHCLFYI